MNNRRTNPVALIFSVLACLICLGGLIAAISLAGYPGTLSLVVFAAAVVVGLFTYGFGEIINLLSQIRDNTSMQAKAAAPVFDELPTL